MSRPRNLAAAAALFNDLAAAADTAPWLELHPIITATNELLGEAG